MVTKTTISIILSTVAVIILLYGGLNDVSKAATTETARQLCYTTNVLRADFRPTIDTKIAGKREIRPIESACPVEHVKIPLDEWLMVPQDDAVTPENIQRDLARLGDECWWRYLEGTRDNMFDGTVFDDNKCRACFVVTIREDEDDFSLQRNDVIKAKDFGYFLNSNPKIISTRNDRCYAQGGQCIPASCSCGGECSLDKGYNPALSREVTHGDCSKTHDSSFKCCYPPFLANSCESSGGRCLDGCEEQDEEWLAFSKEIRDPGWSCGVNGKTCCIPRQAFFSHIGYIQRWGGTGLVLVLTDFEPQGHYVIAFGSPTTKPENFDAIFWKGAGVGAIAGAIGGIIVLEVVTGGTINFVFAAAATGAVAGAVGGAYSAEGIYKIASDIKEAYREFFSYRPLPTIYYAMEELSGQYCHMENYEYA
ncbi:MAG: hypothetical protein ABIC95_01145 [archaeon]